MGFFYSQLFITPKIPPNTSFTCQTVIITGANTGLGKEAARHVARLGVSKLILAVRNIPAGEAAREDIIATTSCPASAIEVWKLDYGSFDQIKAFATRASQLPRIDVIIEGAGISTSKYITSEKHESTINTNVISLFLLAFLLLPTLQRTATQHATNPRLVVVISEVHAWPSFPERNAPSIFTALDSPASKTMPERYWTSKLLEVLVVREIAPRIASNDNNNTKNSNSNGVILNMLNPGLNKTTLGNNESWIHIISRTLLGRQVEVGSRTYIAAAAAGRESHGRYMTDGLVDDEALSAFVRGEEGAEVGRRVWRELQAILEDVQPGVTGEV